MMHICADAVCLMAGGIFLTHNTPTSETIFVTRSYQNKEHILEQKINHTKTFPEVAVRLVDLPSRQPQEPIDDTEKATSYMRTLLSDCTLENLAVVTVDCHIRPINHAIISRETIDQAFYSPSEIISIAILSNAAGILVYHNHPSDVLTPSQDDDATAKNIWQCTKLFSLVLHDFIILGPTGYYSYHDKEHAPFA